MIDALTANGADVRFVGGCVRDALLEQESNDIDIGTPDPPERVIALLRDAGIETRTVPRGIEHGTVTALAGGERYEITTLRRDERTDGRHAEVAFTDDWREDAARRDFTINAMSAAPDGTLYDYFGGQADLQAGRVRFVGDPATRIAEDHLRILRFFRFHAWYGQDEPDEKALDACKAAVDTIGTLSGERVQAEMLKLLKAKNPVPALDLMRKAGALAQLLPAIPELERLARLIEIERRIFEKSDPIWRLVERDPFRRLAALIASGDIGKDVGVVHAIAKRLRLHSIDGSRLNSLVTPPEPITPDPQHSRLPYLLHHYGARHVRDWVLIASADQDASELAWQAMLETIATWKAPTFPLRGEDVLALGIQEGPKVGELLGEVEDWWIECEFVPNREVALAKLRGLVSERRKE